MTLISPEMRNINLIKEGGIPFLFHKHLGYDVSFVCYQNGDYPYLDTLLKGIHLKFLDQPQGKQEACNRSVSNIIKNSVVQYIKKNAKEIDILYLVSFSKENLIYSYFYKRYNKKGLCFIKCDADYGIVRIDYLRNTLKRHLLQYFFNKVDFYAIESTPVLNAFSQKYPKVLTGLLQFPVPYLFFPSEVSNKEQKKEKIILTVSRFGAEQKNSELLINAFSRLGSNDWKLILIGPIENIKFKENLKSLFLKFPHLESKIFWEGNIVDRQILFDWYQKASIFCLPSRWESFGIALLEAAYFGCYPITTGVEEIPAAYDITNNWKYGSQIINESEEDLLKVLKKVTSPEFDSERARISEELSLYVKNNFCGEALIEKLNAIFKNSYQI